MTSTANQDDLAYTMTDQGNTINKVKVHQFDHDDDLSRDTRSAVDMGSLRGSKKIAEEVKLTAEAQSAKKDFKNVEVGQFE